MLADTALSDSVSSPPDRSRPISGAVWRGYRRCPHLTLSPAITAYNNGMMFQGVTGASPNTGAATLAVNGGRKPPSS